MPYTNEAASTPHVADPAFVEGVTGLDPGFKKIARCGWQADPGDTFPSADDVLNEVLRRIKQAEAPVDPKAAEPPLTLSQLRDMWVIAKADKASIQDDKQRWNTGEFERLCNAAPDDLNTVVMVAYHTGMRASEISNVSDADIHLDEENPRVVLSDTKNDEPRVVPLHETLAEHLREHPWARIPSKTCRSDLRNCART